MKLVFENIEPLDPRAFMIMGLSVKTTNNPIGYFGTGLKYAIAVLLRTGHEVSIQTEGKLYKFDTQAIDFRGEKREIISYSLDGAAPIPLGFTTDLGKDWEIWQAYRELASNTIDEHGTIDRKEDAYMPPHTCITIKGDPIIKKGYAIHNEIFITGTPLYTCKFGEIYSRINDAIYFKGVKVGVAPKMSPFTYNLFTNIDLTEDRTLKHAFQWQSRIGQIICSLTDPNLVIRAFHSKMSKTLEGMTDPDYNLSEVVLNRLQQLHKDEPGCLPYSFAQCLERERGKQSLMGTYTPSAIELMRINTLVQMFSKLGITYPHIKFAASDSKDLMGFVVEKEIYLTRAGLSHGLSDLAITMLEEYHHCQHEQEDYTRAYQDFLLRELINLYAEKTETCI